MFLLASRRARIKTGPATSGAAETRRALIPKEQTQGLIEEQFFYFFLRLRKSECKRIVQRVRSLYPEETPEQHARRLILAQSTLSLLGGAVLYLPNLFPAAGRAWKLAGFVGGASMLTRMNLYLILEIALLYGEDIDDTARVAELITVVAASGVSSAAPYVVDALGWHPAAAIPASGIAASLLSKLIGEAAIAFYRAKTAPAEAFGGTVPATVPAL
jgi:hypothetical protein